MSPQPAGAKPVHFWLDATTLLRCAGGVSGIPRTVSQLAEALVQTPGVRLRFCTFHDKRRQYEEVSWQAVPRPKPAGRPTEGPSSAAPRRTRRGRLRRLGAALPAELQQAGRAAYSAIQHLKRYFLRLGRGLARAAAPRKTPPSAPILFEDGDVLFVPGAGWDDLAALDALAEFRRTRRLSMVSLVYDVIPARLPQTCQPPLPELFTPWIHRLLAESDLILTISHWSRRDLLSLAEEFGVPAPPVEVIRLGDAPAGFDRSVRPANLPPGVDSFVLSVGTFEVRKNHWLLYHVWRRLLEEHGDRVPPLVLAGRIGWATNDVRHLIQADPLVRDRMLVLFDATDEELAWLYRNCLFTLYPSSYEGWGLPVAESLAHGKHCVCSNAASLPEVGGDWVDYHDPLDGMRCIERIRRVLFEPGYREGREARIRREYRGATWATAAARIVPLLEDRLGVRLSGATPAAAAEAA